MTRNTKTNVKQSQSSSFCFSFGEILRANEHVIALQIIIAFVVVCPELGPSNVNPYIIENKCYYATVCIIRMIQAYDLCRKYQWFHVGQLYQTGLIQNTNNINKTIKSNIKKRTRTAFERRVLPLCLSLNGLVSCGYHFFLFRLASLQRFFSLRSYIRVKK